MAKRKRSRRYLTAEARLHDARKWLLRHRQADLLNAYCRRYKVSELVAWDELARLGYWDELHIQAYEKEGFAWEYRYDGYTGDMKVVPLGTPDWELYPY